MSDNSAIGRHIIAPHNPEGSEEISSRHEGGDSVGPSQARVEASQAPHGGEGQGAGNQEQEAFLRNFMQMFGGMVPRMTAPPSRKDPIFELQKMGAEKFAGETPNPSLAEDWLRTTIRVFRLLKCTSEEKLRCLETLLKGRALIWWERRVYGMRAESITWEFFEEEFKKEYIGEIYEDKMREEFVALKQGKRSVDEYYEDFKRLSQYALPLVATDKDKCSKFLGGLNKKIHTWVSMNRGNDFGEMVRKARQAEDSLNRPSDSDEEEGNKGSGKRKAEQSKEPTKSFKGSKSASPSQSKKGKFKKWSKQSSVSVASTGGSTWRTNPICSTCNNRHAGECRKATGACFLCGSKDHFIRDCPENKDSTTSVAPTQHSVPSGGRGRGFGRGFGRGSPGGRGQGSTAPSAKPDQKVTARTYAIRAADEIDVADVIAGIVKLCGTTFHALIDPGSTHSYICQRLAHPRKT